MRFPKTFKCPLIAKCILLFLGLMQVNLHLALAEDILSRKVDGPELSETTASEVVRTLRVRHQLPINFILADYEYSIAVTLKQRSVLQVMDQIVAQSPEYRYEVVRGRLVLYPADSYFEKVVDIIDLSATPRLQAAYAYVEILKTQIPNLFDLLPPPVKGAPDGALYTDLVTLSSSGRIVDHLVQLLGDDPSLAFGIVPTRSGRPILTFFIVRASGAMSGSFPDKAQTGCDVCAPTGITYANQTNVGCIAGSCGASLVFDVTGVTSSCDCQGGRLTEAVTTDEGCLPGAVETGPGCPIGSGNSIASCTDTYSLCAAPGSFPEGQCVETYTQELFVCDRLVDTASIQFTIIKNGASCSGSVTRNVISTATPKLFVPEIGDQQFNIGETKPVSCRFMNRTNSALTPSWSLTGYAPNFVPIPTSGTVNVPACMVVDEPLSVQCISGGTNVAMLSTASPISADTGTLSCALFQDDFESGDTSSWSSTVPDPGTCEGQTCGTFTLDCNPNNPTCACVTTSTGGGVCVADAWCDELTVCPNGASDCAPGEVCAVETCCGDPVCMAANCPGRFSSPYGSGWTIFGNVR